MIYTEHRDDICLYLQIPALRAGIVSFADIAIVVGTVPRPCERIQREENDMLSRIDICNEFGKGINIVPLNTDEIKENSINVSIGEYAWTQGDATVCWCGGDEFHLKDRAKNPKKTHTFRKGLQSIFKINIKEKDTHYLVLLPHQTTVVMTKEVIGLGRNVGGAVHSKVGVVAKGVGDTGTMLGPEYCGHLMISLHNITDDVIALKVGSTFASLTFNYLHTPVSRTSNTVSSHTDKLGKLGIKLSDAEESYFREDWKSNLIGVQRKMLNSNEYRDYKANARKNIIENIKHRINFRNLVACAAIVVVFFALLFIARYVDKGLEYPIWEDRFWNVGCSGLVVTFLIGVFGILKKK